MKVIISGGGTGGHIFPAVAIARAIQTKRTDTEILFVGAEGRMEMEKVPAAGFKIIGLPIVGIQRRLTWKNLLVPFKVVMSLWKARKIIREFKPDVAIGVGGYASGPLLRAAVSAGIKTIIQEQNSYPGITNRILSKNVDRICVAYDGLEKYFPSKKLIKTGNPVRPEVTSMDGKRSVASTHFGLSPARPTLLVVGGSLGARSINLAVQHWMNKWVSDGYQVLWQTGKGFYTLAKSSANGINEIQVHEFIKEMDLAYAVADIIISRAGAMSISELCFVKKPVILIPSPNVSEDHQTKNAMALVERNAAILVRDAEALDKLGEEVALLFGDKEKMTQLSANIAAMVSLNAAERIADEVFELTGIKQ